MKKAIILLGLIILTACSSVPYHERQNLCNEKGLSYNNDYFKGFSCKIDDEDYFNYVEFKNRELVINEIQSQIDQLKKECEK